MIYDVYNVCLLYCIFLSNHLEFYANDNNVKCQQIVINRVCRSAHGFSDTDMESLIGQLRREEDNMVRHRGLVPGTDNQTFEMTIPSPLRTYYQRVMAPLNSVIITMVFSIKWVKFHVIRVKYFNFFLVLDSIKTDIRFFVQNKKSR